jgi:D-alanyl-D-alanine dipeptidase
MLRRVTTCGVVLTAALSLAPVAGAEPQPPAGFVALGSVDPTIGQDIRYATPHNFTGRVVDGYAQPVCLLTAPAARALHRVQQGLVRRGYTLKVYDCYRPQRAVDRFVAWARDPSDTAMKAEFYPEVGKSRLFDDGYIARRSGHSRGSTVDLTIVKAPARPARAYRPGEHLVSCYAPQARRFPDDSIDMGTGFDCFDPRAHTLDPRVTGTARADRLMLKRAMEEAGFTGIAEEWWHFTLRDEPYPGTYFNFPVRIPRDQDGNGRNRPPAASTRIR